MKAKKKAAARRTDEFFDVLSADFERLDVEALALNKHSRAFAGLHDRWKILRKK